MAQMNKANLSKKKKKKISLFGLSEKTKMET